MKGFAATLAARPRRVALLNLAPLFPHVDPASLDVLVRPLTGREGDAAARDGERYRAAFPAEVRADLATDAEEMAVIARAFLTPLPRLSPEEGDDAYRARCSLAPDLAPAIPGGADWLAAHLTVEELAGLGAVYASTVRALGPTPRLFASAADVEATAREIAKGRDLDVPAAALATWPREHLTELGLLLSIKLVGALDRLASYEAAERERAAGAT